MQCNRNYERIDAFKCIHVLIIHLIKISQTLNCFCLEWRQNDEIPEKDDEFCQLKYISVLHILFAAW